MNSELSTHRRQGTHLLHLLHVIPKFLWCATLCSLPEQIPKKVAIEMFLALHRQYEIHIKTYSKVPHRKRKKLKLYLTVRRIYVSHNFLSQLVEIHLPMHVAVP